MLKTAYRVLGHNFGKDNSPWGFIPRSSGALYQGALGLFTKEPWGFIPRSSGVYKSP